MERVLDAIRFLSRVGGLKNLLRETRAGTSMFFDAFRNGNDILKINNSSCNGIAIFMPGLFAKSEYYSRLFMYLLMNGFIPRSPLGTSHNKVSPRKARSSLSDAIKKAEDETGIPPSLIGHSKGGSDITGVLRSHPEITTAILIAPPLRGLSRRLLEICIKVLDGDSEQIVDEDVLCDRAILQKIISIVSVFDKFVPPNEGCVKGARNKILHTKNLSSGHNHWNSHTGLPYHARSIILRALKTTNEAA